MKKIDILNLSKYLRRTGDNKLARVGHVNYALEEIEKLKKQIQELTPSFPSGPPSFPQIPLL